MDETLCLEVGEDWLQAWQALRPRLEALGLSAADLTEYDTLRVEAVAALAALASAGQRMAAVHRHMLAFTQRLQALMPNPKD